ncbi:MAG: hypothetical protein HOH58_14850, partial [Opitutaceae bacterium]|nr:hypothetical protein [Opitutaceae bacterium]
MFTLRFAFGLVLIFASLGGVMRALEVTPAEANRPPTDAWLKQVLSVGSNLSWTDVEHASIDAAKIAAQGNRTSAMGRWLQVAQWARLLSSDQRQVTNRWVTAMNSARLGHANIPRDFPVKNEALSALVSAEFVAAVMTSPDFSSSFFQSLTPYDYLPKVLRILDQIYLSDPEVFRQYDQLALPIALIHDVPPPPHWPHGQVSPGLVSRTLPSALRVFEFWVKADRSKMTLHRLTNLAASELKFVVDAAAPFDELVWAQQKQRYTFANLPRAYDAIAYRTDRIERNEYDWLGGTYDLPTILAVGGICIDQGYYACQIGKARGVPTLLFRGAGMDGRHAWFGYLDAQKKWQLDVGRYEEQKFVAGVAFDPQTWGDVNDHELAFLAERFRELPRYRQSRAWLQMAREYLREDSIAAGLAAAKKATNLEPRHVQAWDTVVVAERAVELSESDREFTLRQAARALQHYPDLYARFQRDAIMVLRERGQTSRADHEERQLARKFNSDRRD